MPNVTWDSFTQEASPALTDHLVGYRNTLTGGERRTLLSALLALYQANTTPGQIGAATAAQGTLADSAVQPGDNITDLTNNAGFITGIAWGAITGTLSNQTDLQTALNAKQNSLTIGNLTEATSSVLTITGGTGAIIGSGLTIQVKLAGAAQDGYLSSTDWNTFNNKQAALTTGNLTATGPLSVSASRQVIGGAVDISIADAAADGATKGAAAFTASDFNAASGVISIDYTNGQVASSSTKGFLTSADWTTFNGKVSTGAITGSGLTMATARILGRTTALSGAIEEISVGTGLTLSGGSLTNAGVTSLAGTANEITASAATGSVTLSLPSSLTFTGKTVTGGTFNSGAFNGTVGATTASTGAFTTLSATGAITSTGTGGVFATGGATTLARYASFLSTGASFVVGSDNSAGNAIISGGSAYGGVIATQNAASVFIGVNSAKVAEFSSTGLAVTGVVSTTDPAGGAGPNWKLGVAAAVSPTSPNRTIRVEIAGTSYYIAAKTTND